METFQTLFLEILFCPFSFWDSDYSMLIICSCPTPHWGSVFGGFCLFFLALYALFWIIHMFSAISYLLLIPYSAFLVSDIVVFSAVQVTFVSFFFLMSSISLLIMVLVSFIFFIRFIIVIFNSIILTFLVCFCLLMFLPVMSCIFLLLCMPSNFWLVVGHYEFYIFWCWVFLCSCKYCCTLFWDVVKILGFCLTLSRLDFKFC